MIEITALQYFALIGIAGITGAVLSAAAFYPIFSSLQLSVAKLWKEVAYLEQKSNLTGRE